MPSPPPTLRSRTKPNAPPSSKDASHTTSPNKDEDEDENEDSTPMTPLDILRILLGLLLLSTTLSYFITRTSLTWNYRPPFTRPARIRAWLRGPLHLTDAQLSAYNGTNPSLPILLALNGTIYDVSASPHLYGPGGGYAFFAGRDATRAFVTGCFEVDLNGDLRGVEEGFMVEDGEGEGVVVNGGVEEVEKGRERERTVALKKVEEIVRGWEGVFDGGRGGRYFRVGRVERGVGSGWEGWGERKVLCRKAREGRPRRGGGEGG